MSDITLSKLAEEWLNVVETSVKQSTFAKYVSSINTHILPVFGSKPVSKITPSEINRFVSNKLTQGRIDGSGGLSAKTVYDMFVVFYSILNFGQSHYDVKNAAMNILRPKKKRKEVRVLSQDECAKLEHFTSHTRDIKKVGILLCLYSGLRIGEICALKWGNIHLDKHIIFVDSTLQRIQETDENAKSRTRVVIDTPKSLSSIREIPIPEFLAHRLYTFSKNVTKKMFFLTHDENHFIEPRVYQSWFQKYLRACNIDSINFHALRHTFATHCVEVGFDIKTLSEILGHSDVGITLGLYVHPSLKRKREQMELLQPIERRDVSRY